MCQTQRVKQSAAKRLIRAAGGDRAAAPTSRWRSVTMAASSADSDWMFTQRVARVAKHSVARGGDSTLYCEEMQPPADVNAALRRLPKVDEVLGEPGAARAARAGAAVGGASPRCAARSIGCARGCSREAGARDRQRAVVDAARSRGEVDGAAAPVAAAGAQRHRRGAAHQPRARAAGRARRSRASPRWRAATRNLEYQLDERRRGSRHDHVARAARAADRRRGRAGGQQLRGGGAAGAGGARARGAR